ncbi:MAG: stage II sporulation protein P [Bacillota bacterium]|nr:stage II sporulation protein P [Bacillota bacterium]
MSNIMKGMIIAATIVFIGSTLFFLKVKPSFAVSEYLMDERELGELCIAQVVPGSKDAETGTFDDQVNLGSDIKSDEDNKSEEKAKKIRDIKLTSDPLVIIYHTHSSESYMPFKESNYHRVDEEGTVRDVGNVLENELKKKGINVIHDKTIHDRPSYNESYSRSLATIKTLKEKYPTALYIIDLHRDAAAASATEGKYIEIDGKRVAKFSMVVGRSNENYVELYDFAKKVSGKADAMYSGFGGAIIEKDYNYNEFVSNKALLLEMGNNKNTIEEARECGKYFAEVLASIIKEEQ